MPRIFCKIVQFYKKIPAVVKFCSLTSTFLLFYAYQFRASGLECPVRAFSGWPKILSGLARAHHYFPLYFRPILDCLIFGSMEGEIWALLVPQIRLFNVFKSFSTLPNYQYQNFVKSRHRPFEQSLFLLKL